MKPETVFFSAYGWSQMKREVDKMPLKDAQRLAIMLSKRVLTDPQNMKILEALGDT